VRWTPFAGTSLSSAEVNQIAEVTSSAIEADELAATPVIIYWGAPPAASYDSGRGSFGSGGGGAPEAVIYLPTPLAPSPLPKVAQPTEESVESENLPPTINIVVETETETAIEELVSPAKETASPSSPTLLPKGTPTPSLSAGEIEQTPQAMLALPSKSPVVEATPMLPQQVMPLEEQLSGAGSPILGIAQATPSVFLPPNATTPPQRMGGEREEIPPRHGVFAELSAIQIALAAVAVLAGVSALILHHLSRKS